MAWVSASRPVPAVMCAGRSSVSSGSISATYGGDQAGAADVVLDVARRVGDDRPERHLAAGARGGRHGDQRRDALLDRLRVRPLVVQDRAAVLRRPRRSPWRCPSGCRRPGRSGRRSFSPEVRIGRARPPARWAGWRSRRRTGRNPRCRPSARRSTALGHAGLDQAPSVTSIGRLTPSALTSSARHSTAPGACLTTVGTSNERRFTIESLL